MSHLGRPDGCVSASLTLGASVRAELEKLLGKSVVFATDCVGSAAEESLRIASSKDRIVLLENLRFHLEEEGVVKNKATGQKTVASPESEALFRKQLTSLGDVLVNDAFGTLHRAHSSIVGIALPTVAGYLVRKELQAFASILESGDRIDLAILGGAKVSDKILLIESLLHKVKALVVCGAMAFTFLKVTHEMHIGSSLFDAEGSKKVAAIVEKAQKLGVKLIMPVDFVIADRFAADAATDTISVQNGIPDAWMGVDCGPSSVKLFAQAISHAKTVFWNGPAGAFEMEPFSHATRAIVDALADATQTHHAITVVGGGDSANAVLKWNAGHLLTHVSTGGGASIELLEGKILPGIAAISARQ